MAAGFLPGRFVYVLIHVATDRLRGRMYEVVTGDPLRRTFEQLQK